MTISSGSAGLASGFVSGLAFACRGCGCVFCSSIWGVCGVGVTASVLGALIIIVTPRIVISEPIQPMTPRYIMCMAAAIKGPRASPNVCTRSWVERGIMVSVRKP